MGQSVGPYHVALLYIFALSALARPSFLGLGHIVPRRINSNGSLADHSHRVLEKSATRCAASGPGLMPANCANLISQVGLVEVSEFCRSTRRVGRRSFHALQQRLKPHESGQALCRKKPTQLRMRRFQMGAD